MTAKKATIAVLVDTDQLDKDIKTFAAVYRRSHAMAHVLAVQCLAHAAEHGDTTRLNNFYSVLSSADRILFGSYVRRIYAVLAGWDGVATVPQDTMVGYKTTGEWMTFQKGTFSVIKDKIKPEAKALKADFVVMAEAELIVPDGKKWKAFNDRNVFAETKLFGRADVLDGLDRLIKSATGDRKNLEVADDLDDDLVAELVAFRASLGDVGEVIETLQ